MPVFRPWPYAAKAVIQHTWVVNLLNVWVTFRFPMDNDVKPANGLWLCRADGVLKAITVSAWQDEFTILLTVPNVLALPGHVTLEYAGPDEFLRTTWDKQWEPWGAILSIRVPYLWEDILVVDDVLKRVGIQPGAAAAAAFAYALTIVSVDGFDQMGFFHDNVDAYFRTQDGSFIFITDEGSNTDTFVMVKGKGTGKGLIMAFDEDDNEYIEIHCSNQIGNVQVAGASPSQLRLQPAADVNVFLFSNATSGETPFFGITGFRAGDASRTLLVNVGLFAANEAVFFGLTDYHFFGNLKATGEINANDKAKMTTIGGFAIKLTNKTGAPSVAGDVVIASTITTDAVVLAAASELMCVGIFLDSGIADGSEAWVVTSGIADVHMDAGGCTRGDRIVTSLTPGRGLVNNLPAVAVHFQEIGHAVEPAAANANARCVIHFL